MGPHAFVFFFKSCTKVMKVTAAAVDELEGAKTCSRTLVKRNRHLEPDLTSMLVVTATRRLKLLRKGGHHVAPTTL